MRTAHLFADRRAALGVAQLPSAAKLEGLHRDAMSRIGDIRPGREPADVPDDPTSVVGLIYRILADRRLTRAVLIISAAVAGLTLVILASLAIFVGVPQGLTGLAVSAGGFCFLKAVRRLRGRKPG